MALTKVLPLGSSHSYLIDEGSDFFDVVAVLLKDTVTSIPETAVTKFDLINAGYEADTSGGYPSGGVTMKQLYRHENSGPTFDNVSGAGVVEYDAQGSVWTQNDTTATFSVAAFRWIVIASSSGGAIMAAHDLGSTQSITGDYLAISVTESTYTPGVYPILRFNRVLT